MKVCPFSKCFSEFFYSYLTKYSNFFWRDSKSSYCLLSDNCKEISLKYFEKGHTFMSADSFHHQVEKRKQGKEEALWFQGFRDMCRKNRNRNKFFGFLWFSNQFKLWQGYKPSIPSWFAVVVFKRSETLYLKERNSDEDFKVENFSQRNLEIKLMNIDQFIKDQVRKVLAWEK